MRRSRPIPGAAKSPAIRRPASTDRPTAPARRAIRSMRSLRAAARTAGIIRRLILHYAALAADAGGVDAFLIGSELKRLTRVRSASGVYPAVDQLVTLAADVKAILGEDTHRHLCRRLDRIRSACGRCGGAGGALSARPALGVARHRCDRHRLLRAAVGLARHVRSCRPRDGR